MRSPPIDEASRPQSIPPFALLSLLLLVGCATPDADESATGITATPPVVPADSAGAGLIVMMSAHSVYSTGVRLERALKAALEAAGPISIMAHVDHAANAETAGRPLRPTRHLIFGNPTLGTPLMQASPTTAIDLPGHDRPGAHRVQ